MSLLYDTVKWNIDKSNPCMHVNKSVQNKFRKSLHHSQTTSTIEHICLKHDGNLMQVKTINEHYFAPQLKLLIDQKLLQLYTSSGVFVFDFASDFQRSLSTLKALYEQNKLMDAQDIDEREFLAKSNAKQSRPTLRRLISSFSSSFSIYISACTSSLDALLDMSHEVRLEEEEEEKKVSAVKPLMLLLQSLGESGIVTQEDVELVEELVVGKYFIMIREQLDEEIERVRI